MKHFVLGLDVSMNSTGWAVLSYEDGIVRHIDSGIIKANTKHSHGLRLKKQRDAFRNIVLEYPPSYVAREAGFSKFVKATQVLFKAYGVTEEFFAENDLVEYAVSTIKKYVTGNGKADKAEVEKAMRKLLGLEEYVFASDDESDAVAIAWTHIEKLKETGVLL